MSTQVRYYGDKISNRIAKTPEGFLICQDVPISRTGYQEYLASELTDNPMLRNKIVPVYRPATEVFDIRSLASFEGKPVTNEHPDEDVTPENYQQYSCGHVQNVHAGDGEDSNKVLADLYITDPVLIKLIEKGKREISCGYYAEEKRDSSGKIYQTRIRGNHVAVVQNGRAGNKVCIRDKNPFIGRNVGMRKRRSLSSYIDGLRYLDEEPLVDEDILEDDDFIGEENVYDDDILEDDDFIGEENVYDDDILEDDDFIGEENVYDDDILEDDDEVLGEDVIEDEDFEDDDILEDDDFEDDDILEDDDEVLDEDVISDEDIEDACRYEDDEVFEDDDILEDEDYIGDDDEIDLKEKANEILNDAKRTLRDARRQLKHYRRDTRKAKRMRNQDALRRLMRMHDAIILNDDDIEDDDILEDEDVLDEDIVEDDDILEDNELCDDDILEDDDFIGEENVIENDDAFTDDDFTEDDDVEVTETEELKDSDESEAIDADKTKALREITEASRGITDPNERKQLQDAIYKALCGKTQMSDVMRITKRNRKARMDSIANDSNKMNLEKQQAIYDSFNPHKKTSF